MFKLDLEKAEEPEIKLPTSIGSLKKQDSSRKTSTSALLTMPKPLTVWITINCGKFFKRWEYQITWPASWETYMQIRKPQDWKRSVFFPIPKKGNAKECSNYRTTALISHASKVTLKILQVRLQQYMNHELPDVQAGFRKGRGTRDHIANICWIIKKSKRVPEKHLFLLYWLCQRLCLCGSQQTVENS